MKYELTDETCRQHGRTLHRICALRDIPRHGVQKGDLGGWVESESILSQNDDAWIGGSARVYGNTRIDGAARVGGAAWIDGDAWIGGDARVGGAAWIDGDAWIYGNARIYGAARIYGNARVDGNAMVDGNALIDDDACLLTATIYTSQRLHATAVRQQDGSWRVRVGCWVGSIPELRTLAESDEWVETPTEDIEEARPELLAFVALCEARAARSVA